MTNKGQEYGREIATKMIELLEAFRGELNTHNDIYADYLAEGVYPDSAAAQLADDEEFIMEYLHDEAMALVKAVLTADWFGMYVAGDSIAKSYEEYRANERKQTAEYYHNLNKTLEDFDAWMDRRADGII